MPGRIYRATWGRIFPRLYDRLLKQSEEAGLRERRRGLLTRASGRTLEIGAGTGLNLTLYPDTVTELVLTEPDPHMARQLRERVAEGVRRAEVVEGPGERLPFEDASFDTVACTLVLCTAPDPVAVLREAARILRPGGRALFLEHVRSEDPRRARWQDRLHKPWLYFGNGCHCNRDTLAALEASALEVEDVERGELPKALPIVEPMLVATAVKPA